MYDNNDKKIIEQVLSGRINDFGILVDRYQQVIYNLAFSMIGDENEAKEITQRTFVKVYSKLSFYKPEYKFFSWLYRIGLNETLGFLKLRKNNASIEDEIFINNDTPENIYNGQEKQRMIHKAIRDLKPDYRILVILKYFEDYSYEEISSLTGVSTKKVKSRLFSARQLLKNSLDNLL